MAFTVQLDAYHGPLDLLLHLVRRQELPIGELPLTKLTDQYLAFVETLEQLSPDAVGDFLDIASTLIEMKSRSVLPQAEEATEAIEEPRQDLVQRLLEYKRYREAAARLERRREEWSKRRTRLPSPPVAEPAGPADQPLVGVELWDLVSAFARVMRERIAPDPAPRKIVYDDTPVQVHMRRIDDRLRDAGGPVSFADLFPESAAEKSTLIGVFLAVLELIRHRHAIAAQPERYGEITLEAGPAPLPEGFDQLVTSAA